MFKLHPAEFKWSKELQVTKFNWPNFFIFPYFTAVVNVDNSLKNTVFLGDLCTVLSCFVPSLGGISFYIAEADPLYLSLKMRILQNSVLPWFLNFFLGHCFHDSLYHLVLPQDQIFLNELWNWNFFCLVGAPILICQGGFTLKA